LRNAKPKKKERAELRTLASQNAEKYHVAHAKARTDLLHNRRTARSKGSFYVDAEPKVALVIRIRGINKLHPTYRKILQLFRLRQLHNAVFLRLNKATINMWRKVEPYVAYGYPTRETISHLIYKRGFLKLNKQRIPITDNSIIQEELKAHKITSIEDLVNEIHTVGPNFKVANKTLWPFKLTAPRKGIEKKRHPYYKGGAWGNREEQINELTKKML